MTRPARLRGLRPLLIVGGLLAAVTGGLFVLLFERVESSESVGPSGRALRDRYWAASLLLEEMQVPTTMRYGLGRLPEPTSDAVIVVLATDPSHREVLAQRLHPWVEAGGHLLIAPPEYLQSRCSASEDPCTPEDEHVIHDPLFDRFGIPLQQPAAAEVLPDPVVEVVHSASEEATVRTLVTYQPLHVGDARCESILVRPAEREAYPLRARCSQGEGQVTALSSADLIQNSALQDERADNAAFFWDSVAPGDQPPAQAILVLRGDAPGFSALLWERAWPAILSLVALLVAGARFAGQRFGPRIDRATPARRSILEHLDAAGAMLWRASQRDRLVAPMRAAVRLRLSRRVPAVAHLEGESLVEAVAEALDRPVGGVREALLSPPPEDRPGFVRMTQALQSLWQDS